MTAAEFVAQHIPGCERGFGECQALGFYDGNGEIEAGIVYHNWQPEAGVIEISAASINRTWLNRERLRAIFDYPFNVAGCRMAVARIGEANARARRIWRSLGADEFVIPKLRSPTEAEIIYTLSAETWADSRLSRASHGKTQSAKAT